MMAGQHERPLQSFEHRLSPYARPHDDWHCGRAATGAPCLSGPDGKGRCVLPAACRPRRQQGRWICTRSEAAGGSCREGPQPDGRCCLNEARCRPRRSWRARRRYLSRGILAVTIGMVLIVLMSDSVPALFEPGDRTAAHAEINDCRDCHLTADHGPGHWLRAAFGRIEGEPDSARCLRCHSIGARPDLAHGLEAEQLAPLTAKAVSGGGASLALRAARTLFPSDGSAPDCGTCHAEHRGAKADLEAVASDRCQVCHAQPFGSLASGHPEFSRYPAPRRTRIIFDHVSHFGRHFEKDADRMPPGQCKSCHEPDDAGELMLVKSYEVACARCHDADIAGAGQAGALGLPVISVFGLDTATLAGRGFDVGDWPRHADAEPGPFLRLLLGTDPEVAAAQQRLADTTLWDLRDADEAELADASVLAWALKNWLAELRMQGPLAIVRRLEQAWGRKLDHEAEVRLLTRLPVAVVERAIDSWFPRLQDEVERRRAGEPLAAAAPARPVALPLLALAEPGDSDLLGGGLFDDLGGEDEAPADDEDGEPTAPPPAEILMGHGGWYVDDLSLRYRPAGHRDTFVHAWLDAEPGAALFDQLSAADAPGRCGFCHSVDQPAGSTPRVNWAPRKASRREHPFTVFAHTAHFSLLGEPGCGTCHELREDAPYLESFEHRDPGRYASNFSDIDRAVCADCHVAELAGDDCTLCHQYHIGEFEPTVPPTRLEDFQNM